MDEAEFYDLIDKKNYTCIISCWRCSSKHYWGQEREIQVNR
jgi:hypothetical protein